MLRTLLDAGASPLVAGKSRQPRLRRDQSQQSPLLQVLELEDHARQRKNFSDYRSNEARHEVIARCGELRDLYSSYVTASPALSQEVLQLLIQALQLNPNLSAAVARACLELGADPDAVNDDGITALLLAEDPATRQLLREAAGPVDASDPALAAQLRATIEADVDCRQLMESIGDDNIRKVVDLEGRGPLHWLMTIDTGTAISNLKTLLASGMDVNAADERGFTPLHVFVQHRDLSEYSIWGIDKLQLLLSAGADPLFRTGAGSFLHVALQRDDCEELEWPELLELVSPHYPDIGVTDDQNRTLLHFSAWSPYLTSRFLDMGLYPGQADVRGRTPLVVAEADAAAHPLAVALLRVASEKADSSRNSWLHAVVPILAEIPELDHSTATAVLGAEHDPGLRNDADETALHFAVRMNLETLVDMLLQNGADVDARAGSNAAAPLHVALQTEDDCSGAVPEQALQHLIGAGADLTKKTGAGETIFDLALADRQIEDGSGHERMIQQLVAADGSPLNEVGQSGCTPLELLCAQDCIPLNLLALFLQAGAQVSLPDEAGNTHNPLLRILEQDAYALEANLPAAVLLLNHGADPDVLDHVPGYEALMKAEPERGSSNSWQRNWADRYDYRKVAERVSSVYFRLLLGAGADPNKTNKYGRPPLPGAARWDTLRLIQLLNAGADPNGGDEILLEQRLHSAAAREALRRAGAHEPPAQDEVSG